MSTKLTDASLADSFAANDYLVVVPDLFNGETVQEGPGVDLSEFSARHPPEKIDRIINVTVNYLREKVGVERLGGVGYCFGGRYVPRFLAEGQGIDVGFVAHPSFLTQSEIQSIANPISIAAGSKYPTGFVYEKYG